MHQRIVTCVAGGCLTLLGAGASVAACGSSSTGVPSDSLGATPPGIWTNHRSLDTPHGEMPAVTLDGIVYTAGGQSPGAPIIASVEAYDPAADTWTALPAMPSGRHHHGMAAVGGKLYVIGGYSTPTQQVVAGDVFEYDPTQREWRTRAPMPTPRAAFAVAVLDGKIHVIGGARDGVGLDTHEIYDPVSDSWTSAARIPVAREHFGAAAIDGVIYAVGGRTAVGPGQFDEHVVLHAFRDGAWTTLASMPTRRSGLGVGAMNGRLYAIGGEFPGGVFAQVEEFDPVAGTWRSMKAMPAGRHGIGVANVGNRLFVVGGAGSAQVTQAGLVSSFTLP